MIRRLPTSSMPWRMGSAWPGGNQTGQSAWSKRAWYTKAKAAGKIIFTDPYKSKTTGDIVCAAGVPYTRNGAPSGVVSVTFKTDTLAEKAKNIKYDGQGKGMIINPASELILASADEKGICSLYRTILC